MIFDGSRGSNYDINLTGTYLSGAKNQTGYGVYYRATNSENITGYCFQFDPGAGNSFVVRKVINGNERSTFQSVSMTSVMGSDFQITDPHNIQISVKGTEHIITVDGIQVMSFVDDAYAEGYVGARTWNNTRVKLDNISVRNNS